MTTRRAILEFGITILLPQVPAITVVVISSISSSAYLKIPDLYLIFFASFLAQSLSDDSDWKQSILSILRLGTVEEIP